MEEHMERRTVVLVEDDPGMEEMVTAIVEQLDGADVVVADSAGYAETLVTELRPALVIVDDDSPAHSGWQVVTSLRATAETRDIPVIALCTDSQVCRDLVSQGAEAFLHKPFDVGDLVDQIQFYTQSVPPRPPAR
jgi:DNA-binding response OmpR family regulator